MATTFSISRSHVSGPELALRDHVRAYTNSDAETTSILRSLDRLGSDATILHYQVTRSAERRVHPHVTGNRGSWHVRAVRAQPEPQVL
jgi:hypothetical protein